MVQYINRGITKLNSFHDMDVTLILERMEICEIFSMCQVCQLSLMYILQLIPPLVLTLHSGVSASRKLLAKISVSPQTKRRQSCAPLCQLKLFRSTAKLTYLELPTFPWTNSTPTLSLPLERHYSLLQHPPSYAHS